MYPISNAVKALFDSEQRQILRITGVDKNGTSINITDENVMINGFNIDRFSCNGNKLEIGTACSAELTLKMDNRQGQFNSIVFEGTELFVEIGIADWTQTNPTVNWIPCGYFTCYDQPRTMSIITIHALDRMMRFDDAPPSLIPWVDNNGNQMVDNNGNEIYFNVDLDFPYTVEGLVEEVANRCNVPFMQDLSSFPNFDYSLLEMPSLQQTPTYRNIIQWCAGIMGCNAWIDWTGALQFSFYGNSSVYTTTVANRFSSDLYEDDITITGVQYTNTQNVTIVSGSADYAFDLTGNYLAADGIAQILPNINTALNGFTYRPFSATVINAPYLWPMDFLTFTDKDGNDHSCAVTNVNFGLNGTTVLQGKGETSQTNSGVAPAGVTNDQAFLIEKAAEKTAQLDESLNQEGIFNRLTDNGETQGLLLYNGKVYLNASYINTGTLVANFIKGGTLTLGGDNNVNGVLRILDSNGDVIGTWNKDGITVYSGEILADVIKGGTLTLGGTGNVNGLLELLDDDNDVVGSFNSGGISIEKGSISIGGFSVDTSGHLTANDATMSGTFSATDSTTHPGHTKEALLGSGSLAFYYDNHLRSHIYENGNGIDGHIGISTYGGTYTEFSIGSGYVSIGNSYSSNDLTIYGDLDVRGTKSRAVSTDQYSDRLLYCYETPSPMFGDVGEGVISDDGMCYVALDAVFAQTISTTQYQVFLQKYGDGDCYIAERKGAYFIVRGTPGLAFGWEIKAKQKDYDQRRLDNADGVYTPHTTDYGAEAAQYITNLQRGRIAA